MASNTAPATSGDDNASASKRTTPRIPLDPSRVPVELENMANLFSTDVDRLSGVDDFNPATATTDELHDYMYVILTERTLAEDAERISDPFTARCVGSLELAYWEPDDFRRLDTRLRLLLWKRLTQYKFILLPNSGDTWTQIYQALQDHYKQMLAEQKGHTTTVTVKYEPAKKREMPHPEVETEYIPGVAYAPNVDVSQLRGPDAVFTAPQSDKPTKTPARRSRALKKCLVCRKEDCWSSNHSVEERDAAWQARMTRKGTVESTPRVEPDRHLQQAAIQQPTSEIKPKSAELSNHAAVKDQYAVKPNLQLRQTQKTIIPSAHVVKVTDEQDNPIASGTSETFRTSDPSGSPRILKSRQMRERRTLSTRTQPVTGPQRNSCANAHVCSKLIGPSHKNNLQAAVTIINDNTNSDKLAATILMFGAFSRFSAGCSPAPLIQKSLAFVDSAMANFHKWRSKSASHKALCRQNCPGISTVRALTICAPMA
ncbi:hypothetical protein SEPCBS119000_002350 [Sporothrix epigloea]|uniref:Uncharacterized protein n=1 Tax=Sporothrix epigloea TaxID=1892477 RepID=A0ABP0DFQ5_9PEZI